MTGTPPRRMLLGAVAALGLALAACTPDEPSQEPEPTGPTATEQATSEPPTTEEPTTATADESVCGLEPGDLSADTAVPDVNWVDDPSLDYPTSPEAGPADTADEGYRYCYQHSTAGALLFLANGLSQAVDPDLAQSFAEYAVADGPYRAEMLEQVTTVDIGSFDPVIAGYAVRDVAENEVRASVVVEAGEPAGPPYMAAITADLVWQDGDWKVSSTSPDSLTVELVRGLDGYVPWGP